MTTADQVEDRWLDVLAGRAQPGDTATQQAALLRGYIGLQAAEDLARVPDPEGEKRVLNRLRARGAFRDVPAVVKPAPNPVSRLIAWLFPQDGGHLGRYAAVATVAFAVVAASVLMPENGDDNDLSSVKSLPGAVQPGVPATSEALVMSAQPAQEAAQLVQVLKQAGVAANIGREGGDQVVRAQIPPDRFAAVQQGLAGMGLAAQVPGPVVFRFRKLP